MGYKIMILAFGFWLPANNYYYATKEAAESVACSIIRNKLGGNEQLCKVINAGKNEKKIR